MSTSTLIVPSILATITPLFSSYLRAYPNPHSIRHALSEILKILLRDETLVDDVDLKQLAKKTESFSGSDLKREYLSPSST